MAEPDDLDVRLLRSDFAASPRTMVDILRETAAMFPDDPAIDNGAVVRTYGELVERADEVADHLADMGVGPGSKVGVRVESGTVDLYVAIAGLGYFRLSNRYTLSAVLGREMADAEDLERYWAESARMVGGYVRAGVADRL